MKLQLLFIVVSLLVVLVSGYTSEDVSRMIYSCRNAGASCSSKPSQRCCTGNNCVVPALSGVGKCTAAEPACIPNGQPCDKNDAQACCSATCNLISEGSPDRTCQPGGVDGGVKIAV